MEPKAKWTFMVYMAGDNSLSDCGDDDLGEMRQVGSCADVNVVVQFDNAGNQGTKRYLVRAGGVNEPTMELGETDCGSPEVLNSFIAWAAETYPADRYALVLWSHGSGWRPEEIDRIARSVDAKEYTAKEAATRAASPKGRTFFRTSWEAVFKLPTAAARAVCVDDGTGHSLDTIELGKVLAKAREVLAQPLDLLGMDACLMSNVEVACQAQPYVRYLVASEETEPGDGWPYDVILRKLVDQPTMTPENMGKLIVTSYVKSYLDIGYSKPVTQVATDLARLATLTDPLDRMAELMTLRMAKIKSKIRDAQIDSAHFLDNSLWDIAHFGEQFARRTRDKELRKTINNVQTALASGAGHFVVAEAHNGAKVARCKGVTIYLPLLTEVSQFYAETDFAQQHRWAAMLQAYHTSL
jgi:hypothetical protein